MEWSNTWHARDPGPTRITLPNSFLSKPWITLTPLTKTGVDPLRKPRSHLSLFLCNFWLAKLLPLSVTSDRQNFSLSCNFRPTKLLSIFVTFGGWSSSNLHNETKDIMVGVGIDNSPIFRKRRRIGSWPALQTYLIQVYL